MHLDYTSERDVVPYHDTHHTGIYHTIETLPSCSFTLETDLVPILSLSRETDLKDIPVRCPPLSAATPERGRLQGTLGGRYN